MTTYMLIKGIEEPQQIQIVRRKNGVIQYGYTTLQPGVLYEAENDAMFIDSLYNAKVTKRERDSIVQELDALGIKYTRERTRCCGGSRKMVSYQIVEVMQDEAQVN